MGLNKYSQSEELRQPALAELSVRGEINALQLAVYEVPEMCYGN